MTNVFYDGFDKYGAPDTSLNGQTVLSLFNLMQGEWSQLGSQGVRITNPLSAHGYAVNIGSQNTGGGLTRSFTAQTRVIGGCRFANTLGSSAAGIVYVKAGTACFSIAANTSGNIVIRTGDTNGTAVQTSTTTIGAGTTNVLAWDVTIGASSSYSVWLNNVLILSGTGNTGNGNTSGDAIVLGSNSQSFGGGGANQLTIDDIFQFDTTGSTNNAAVTTGPVVDTGYALSDSQAQFTFGQGALGSPYSITASTLAIGSNNIILRKFTPAYNCTLQNVNLFTSTTNGTAHIKALLYADSSGSPGSLIAAGNEVTGVTANTLLTLPFASGQSLTGGTSYWIGAMYDQSLVWYCADNGLTGWYRTYTYSSGAPGTAGAATSAIDRNFYVWGAVTGITGNNWSAVTSNPPPMPTGSDISYLSSSTVGNEDLYTMASLQQTPNTIYCSATKGFMRNSDGGARTIDLRKKSGTSSGSGGAAGQSPTTAMKWLSSYFETDPATSAAWTASNLNAAKDGVKVAS